MRTGIAICLLALLAGACEEPQAMPAEEADAAREAVLEALPAPFETVALTFRVEAARDALEDVVAVVDHRLRRLGMGTAEALDAGPPRMVCRVRDGGEAYRFRVMGVITRPGSLAFRIAVDESEARAESERREELGDAYELSNPEWAWLSSRVGETDVLVETPSPLSESDFTERDLERGEARPIDGRGWGLFFALKSDRRQAFHDFTDANVRRRLAIVIDGRVNTLPVIRSPLPGEGVIEGGGDGFSEEEARALELLFGLGPSYDATLVLEPESEPDSE